MKPIIFALICLATVCLFYYELRPPIQKTDYIDATEYYLKELNKPKPQIQSITITHQLKIEYKETNIDYNYKP